MREKSRILKIHSWSGSLPAVKLDWLSTSSRLWLGLLSSNLLGERSPTKPSTRLFESSAWPTRLLSGLEHEHLKQYLPQWKGSTCHNGKGVPPLCEEDQRALAWGAKEGGPQHEPDGHFLFDTPQANIGPQGQQDSSCCQVH